MSINRLNFKPDPNLLQTIRTEADFANLIHTSTSTASRQLHKIYSLPDSPHHPHRHRLPHSLGKEEV